MGSEAFLPLLKPGDILLALRNTRVAKAEGGSAFRTAAFVLDGDEIVRLVGPVEGFHNEGSILESANYGAAQPLGIKAFIREIGNEYPIPYNAIRDARNPDCVEKYAIEGLQKAVPSILKYRRTNSSRFKDRLR
jgi:hypothetical protein